MILDAMEMSEFSKRLSVDINVKSSRTVSWGSSTLKVQDDANKLKKKKKKETEMRQPEILKESQLLNCPGSIDH